MSEGPRLFGPRVVKQKTVPEATAKLAVEPRREQARDLAGKGSELAELNAKYVGYVFKRALRRKNQEKSG